jgi:hypothetical protein
LDKNILSRNWEIGGSLALITSSRHEIHTTHNSHLVFLTFKGWEALLQAIPE